MKIIRWAALIPTLLIVGAITAFTLFMMEDLVKRAIEKAGTAANGARVELDGVDISLRKMSVTLKHLQVTDAAAPMTNTVEVDLLKFDLAAKPLAWRKIIIENATITNILTETPRKYSGEVKISKEEAAKKAKEKEEQEPSVLAEKGKEAAHFAMTNLKEQYDPKKMVQLENLASYKKIQEEQTRFTQLSQDWESKTNALNVDEKVQKVKTLVDQAKNEKFGGVEGIAKAKNLIDEAGKAKDDLKKAKDDLGQLSGQFKSEMVQAKNALKDIDALRKQDTENALGDLKAGFSADGITKGLVGPEYFSKIQTGLGWFHKIRKMIPKSSGDKKKKEEKAKMPRKGMDIPFPFHYNWPAFHLKLASLSGVTSGPDGIAYDGTLKDVTSDPALVGKPIVLALKGKKQGGPESLTLQVGLDYTTDVPREQVQLDYRGLPLAGTKLGKVGDGPVAITQGEGVVNADISVKSEELSGTIKFVAAPVTLAQALTPEQSAKRLNQLLNDVLTNLKQMDINLLLSDTLLSPNIKIETSLDNQINAAVKGALQKEIEEIKAQVRARVDELVNGERQKLMDLVNGKTAFLNDTLLKKDGSLQGGQEQLQKAIEDLKKQGTSALPIPGLGGSGSSEGEAKPALPDLKNIFKRK